MRQKKLMKWFGMFFAVMFLFTVLSRAADSVNVARVRTKTIQNQVITHTVKGSGKVEGIRERAVFAMENQKVGQVLVQEGQSVKKGDVLLRLSTGSLKESVSKKQAEIEELKLKVGDLESKDSVGGQKKSNDLSRAQENYNVAVQNGDINIANAEMEVNVARQKLQNYYDSLSFSDTPADTSREQSLLDEIRAREEALNQVIMSRNQEVLTAEREIEDARMADASDSSLQNAKRELEDAQKELEKLQKLLKRKGAVKASADGVVKKISASTGSSTTSEAAVILYETKGNFRLTGTITKDDLKYIEIGAKASVKGSNGKEVEDVVIESIKEDEADADSRIISMQVPEGTLSIGETAEFSVSKDEGPYTSCIPLSGLFQAQGRYFVYVVDTQDSVLGEVMVARKVDVNVNDKNESLAALQENIIAGSQLVIVDCDREIEDGSRVRLQES